MSRHPQKSTQPTGRQERIDFVDYIAQTSASNAFKLQDIAQATLQDPTLQAVVDAVRTRNWFERAKRLNINTYTYKARE